MTIQSKRSDKDIWPGLLCPLDEKVLPVTSNYYLKVKEIKRKRRYDMIQPWWYYSSNLDLPMKIEIRR